MPRSLLCVLLLTGCATAPADPPPSAPDVAPRHADPPVDTDPQAVLGDDDRCPGQPETRNGYHDHDGCPDTIPEDLAALTGTIRGARFALDNDMVDAPTQRSLGRVAQVLKRYPDVLIEISGHRESIPTFIEYSRNITHRWANAVKLYLVAQGIAADRIETRGAGPDEPIVSNKTAAGRAHNRRIELTILHE